jgi:hypothetical protein
LRVDEPVRAYLRSEAEARDCTPSEVARSILARHIAGEDRTVAALRQEVCHGLDTLAERVGAAEAATSSSAARQAQLTERLAATHTQVTALGARMETARQTLEGAQQEVSAARDALERARRRLPWKVWLLALGIGLLPALGGALHLASQGYVVLGETERSALYTGVRFQIALSGLEAKQRAQVRALLGWEE